MVIDPGHGGKDVGAIGSMSYEKDVNLNVALAFGAMIEKNCPDVKVIYTRTTDNFLSLRERANIANRNKADLFISIHTNAIGEMKTVVHGASTYTLGPTLASASLAVAERENSVDSQDDGDKKSYANYGLINYAPDVNYKPSRDLARFIQQGYVATGRKNMGVLQAGFHVLKATNMPSVLTEVGFISHPDEERYINSASGVQELARSIYNGFRSFRKQTARVSYPAVRLPKSPTLPVPSSKEANRMLAMADNTSGKAKSGPAVPNDPPSKNDNGKSTKLTVNGVVPEVKPVNTKPYPRKSATETTATNSAPATPVAAPAVSTTPPAKTTAPAKAATPAKAEKADSTTKSKTTKADDKTTKTPAAPAKKAEPAKSPATPAKSEKSDSTAKSKTTKPADDKKAAKPVAPAKAATPAKSEKSDSTAKSKTTKPADDKKAKAPETLAKASAAELPVFKVQLLAADRQLPANDPQFKGLKPVESYKEGGLYKYTHGSSSDFATIRGIRNAIADRFPNAFVVAFYQGKRITTQEAMQIANQAKAKTNKPAPANNTKKK
ncbi:MAG: N-acetylmuramoyl-L-alanine amidase [Bacteroidaceae bacterium]|nr:N-acetylmuramoyl-L-alanine amidase [Bacteroidaceae bacterium]